MKSMIKILNIFFALILILLIGCKTNSTSPNKVASSAPSILSITAEKTQILYGGDPAIITCNATGGNLKYVWQVDLGDIIPMNSEHSMVSFSGAACCVGDKTINKFFMIY